MVERVFEKWGFRCLDKWDRYYSDDVTPHEAELLNALRNNTELAESDEVRMDLYDSGFGILRDVYVRQFKREYPNRKIIEILERPECDYADGECIDEIGFDCPFGYTEIKYVEGRV